MTQLDSARLGAPPKGYVAQVHTRTEPDAKQGLFLLAGGRPLSDTLNALGNAAHNPEARELIRAIIEKDYASTSAAGLPLAGLSPGASAPSAPTAQELPPGDPGRVQAQRGQGPDLWAPLCPALQSRVSEQNFETWLSSVRFLGADGDRLQLAAPNDFCVEYLTQHYTEVIQEELSAATGQHYEIEFLAAPEVPQEAPKEEEAAVVIEAPKPEPQTEEDLTAIWLEEDKAIWVLRHEEDITLAGAKHLSYTAQARMGKSIDNRRALEDKERAAKRSQARAALIARLSPALLRQPGNPHDQRQYHDRDWREAAGDAAKRSPLGAASISSFETSGGANRRDLKDAARALKPSHDRPRRDSS